MGIDVYARWRGQTEAEKQAQFTGFSIVSGNVGYLREAYHGEPYATKVLVPEGWQDCPCKYEDDDCDHSVQIPAATLRERLPATLAACRERYAGDDIVDEACKSYEDFVKLCEQKEAETGEPVRIRVSA